MTSLDKIDHIVVLMLENRSFDNMLGRLYPKFTQQQFNGLTGQETNPDPDGNPVRVWNNSPDTSKSTMTIPDPDPGELWTDMNIQIYGTPNVPSPSPPQPPPPPMLGFVENYLAQEAVAPGNYVAKAIMHYFEPAQVPVISQLATQFAVSDTWHASAPCQTWPNRFFVHTGTADGYQNNDPYHLLDLTTIYNRCELAGTVGWKIYFHDIAQASALTKLWLLSDHFHLFDTFITDAKTGNLPAYSFIEPRYFAFIDLPNDQHPPHNVTLGEKLIADTYNALRAGPHWTKTLLIIIYDEHGGCFDHAPPPPATPPSKTPSAPFNFDRYGVRVPAVLVSPYIKSGTILRPPDATPFDHTSVIATLRKRYPELGPPLTDRDAVAPTFDEVLSLSNPTNLGPPHIDPLPYSPTLAEVALAQVKPLNGMQRALVHLAANLPNTAGADFSAVVTNHITQLQQFGLRPLPAAATTDHVAASAAFVREKLGDFFRGLPQQ
jgi:phospholipase C